MAKIDIERIKREKDGLDVLEDIYRLAKLNQNPDEDTLIRMKWYGLYKQKPDESHDKDEWYYMMRVKIPRGALSIKQLNTLVNISKKYARNTADITTRQAVQYHWLQLKDLPDLFDELEKVGLNSEMSCGDCPRNIVSCPVSGHDINEIHDVRGVVNELYTFFKSNKSFSNLPKKYKIGVDGCSSRCSCVEIQDVSFSAFKNNGKLLYYVKVGGGLGSNKQIAKNVGAIKEEDIQELAKDITIIYRDFGNRDKRIKARLGHLVELWGIDKFNQKLREITKVNIIDMKEPEYPIYNDRHHYGITPSKEKGKSIIGCSVLGGRIHADLAKVADVMTKYNASKLCLSVSQDLSILDVPNESVDDFIKDITTNKIKTSFHNLRAKTQTCTGIEYCNLAVVETKIKHEDLVLYLEEKYPDFDEDISINISGCPNSCSHPHIADLGFVGCKVKLKDVMKKGFKLYVGGKLEGDKSNLGKDVKVQVSEDKIINFVSDLIEDYIDTKTSDNFNAFVLNKDYSNFEKSKYF